MGVSRDTARKAPRAINAAVANREAAAIQVAPHDSEILIRQLRNGHAEGIHP